MLTDPTRVNRAMRLYVELSKTNQDDPYQLDSRPLAFALPLSHTDDWRALGALVLESTSVLPGDSRWGRR